MSWTDERVELLKKLWAEGLSASQIAAELGGVTRNAVIGKVHRLSLSGRAKPSGGAARTSRPKAPRPPRPSRPVSVGNTALKAISQPQVRRAVVVPIEDVVVPIPLRATILTLTDRTCKWPIGDPTDEAFCFCGHLPRASSPYCEYHSRVAFQPNIERRRDRREESL
ncbi:MAG: GcrA cell cycle regulator [Bauldia sp.]|nr:GcrA cell cycle regulator [Bauldia sp.]MCW5716796.1 GcrA cell cycle regulator [Bauldia sp.]